MADSPMATPGMDPAAVERVRSKWLEIAQSAPDEATKSIALKQLATIAAEHPVYANAPSGMRTSVEPPAEPVQAQEIPLKDKALSYASRTADALEAGASGFNDRFAFGLPSRALEASGLQSQQQRQAIEAQSPIATQLGGGTGMGADMLMGPGAAIGKLAAGTVKAVAPRLANSALGRIVETGAAGGLGGGTYNAADAAVNGASIPEQAKAFGTGAAYGAPIGGGAQAAAEGLSQMASGVLGSEGAQARRMIEKHGGKVGIGNSGSGGALDAELAGLPANDKGIGEAAQRSAGRIIDKTDEMHRAQVSEPYRAEKAAIDASPEAQKQLDVSDVYQGLMKVYGSSKLTPGERGTVKSLLDDMDARYLHKDLGLHLMTEERVNDFKGALQRLSGAGQPGQATVPEAQLSHVAHLLKQKVDGGPYGELNRKYAEGMTEKSALRQGLGLGPKASSNEMADQNRVRNVLMRQTQDTTTGGATTMDLPQVKAAYPELQRDIELPEVLAAKDTLSLHAGAHGHGGLINRLPPGLGLGASAAMALGHQGAASLAPLAAEFAARNASPIAGRLLYTPAQELEMMLYGIPGAGAARLSPPGSLYLQERQRR